MQGFTGTSLQKFLQTFDVDCCDYQMSLAFEPIVSALDSKSILYEECLARLESQGCRNRTAADFVPQIEALGLITDFDLAVLNQMERELHTRGDVTLAINISLQNLTSYQSWFTLLLRIEEFNIKGLVPRVIFEITEQLPWLDLGLIAQRISALQALGCRVALDDFGAGLTPLSAVTSIEFDIIKIDRSVLKQRRVCGTGASNLASLIGFASCYCPHIVVEGIETEEDAEIARVAGANWLQGYHYSRKMSHISSAS